MISNKAIIYPSTLSGDIKVPISKSFFHRILIGLFLSGNFHLIENFFDLKNLSTDLKATYESLKSLDGNFNSKPVVNCEDSGSTLRFLLPIATCLCKDVTFKRSNQLSKRPIDDLVSELSKKGCVFNFNKNGDFNVKGTICSGTYTISGDVSSQYLSGLLMALPLLKGKSSITLTTPLFSKGYVDITLEVLKTFGIKIKHDNDYSLFEIKGNQKYILPEKIHNLIEGDWSQGSFWYVANALGNNINITNLDCNSVQPDRKIIHIIQSVKNNMDSKDAIMSIDCQETPDIVPILSVFLSQMDNKAFKLIGLDRLKFKESDRILSTSKMLSSLGIKNHYDNNTLTIFPSKIKGGSVDTFNDHRIIMSSAIASTLSNEEITINNYHMVNKSYPDFWNDFKALGGKIEFNKGV